MSNTRLIYVSKETAEIANDDEGSFVNSVDDGIVVKVGDEINVEQIAINSIGVGAEIIEIPKRIRGYKYKTNAMALNCAMYIHHNTHPLTIMMPLYGMDTINTTTTDRAYGYMKNGGNFPPPVPFANATTKFNPNMERNRGQRFYLGSYIFATNQSPQVPTPLPTGEATAENAVPSIGVFEFMRTDLTFEVDTGYDNPANIANKITQDFHAGNATPQLFNLDQNGGALPAYSATNAIGPPIQLADLGVWTENTCCYTLPAYPPNADGGTNLNNYSPYQSVLAYQNPFYAYYGSRLLCDNVAIGGVGDKNNSWLNANNPNAGANPPVVAQNNQIYMLEDMNADPAGTGTIIENNTILTTNLLYDYFNVKMLRDFIHSQKQFSTETTTTTDGLNTNRLIRAEAYAQINIGRVNDSSTDSASLSALQSPLQATNTSVLNALECAVFFDDIRWGKGKFSASGANSGFYIDYNYTTPFNETPYKPLELNKKLDCMIFPVYTGTYNGVPEYNCGILLNAKSIPTQRLLGCNYALVDLGFMNFLNPCVMVLGDKQMITKQSPTTLGDYNNCIQVGSPNMNMLFDETRGRFALENMCWNNMIQNTPEGGSNPETPNPSAGQEAITQAYNFGDKYQYHSNNGDRYGLKYGQSGIGILDISVVDEDYNLIKIDYDDDDDIKEKFNNSLLSRLGFTYKQLTNKNGRPDVIFTQRCYESKKPVRGVSIFPYPLTTNLRFDTSIDIGLSNNANGLPMFDLFPSGGYTVNVSAVSDRVYGLNLPKKLENPFWLIKSDIIDGVEFNSEKTGGGKQNVVAVCNRAYLAGDFAFSFSTSYAFKATKEFVISGIKTAILNPDLTPADIDEATTVIYKIVSPSPFFQAQEEAELKEQNKKK
jgi:hypothetical protein